MRRKQRFGSDDLRPEYDLDYAKAVRGKYYHRLKNEGGNVVVLEPDVAKSFRDSAAVNEALRMLLEMTRATRHFAAHSGATRYGIPGAILNEQITLRVGREAHCPKSRFDPTILQRFWSWGKPQHSRAASRHVTGGRQWQDRFF